MTPICPHCGEVIVTLDAPRTERQAQVLTDIIDFEKHQGRAPSLNESAMRIGVTRSTIQKLEFLNGQTPILILYREYDKHGPSVVALIRSKEAIGD